MKKYKYVELKFSDHSEEKCGKINYVDTYVTDFPATYCDTTTWKHTGCFRCGYETEKIKTVRTFKKDEDEPTRIR